MKLSVVVCAGGREKALKKCIKSLESQSFSNWELVVVSLTKVGPLLNRGRWVRDPGKGLAKARDLGWRKAKGEIVAFIDDDVVLDKDWAENLVKIFDENEDVGGVSGPTIVPKRLLQNRLVFWWYGRKNILAKLWVKLILDNQSSVVGRITKIGWWSPGSNFKSCLKLKGLWEVDFLEACNMTLRRSLIKKAGGFDLGFKGTSEWCELDLAIRVKELGYRLVWHRDVRVKHEVSKGGVYVDRRRILERIRNYLKWRKRWLR